MINNRFLKFFKFLEEKENKLVPFKIKFTTMRDLLTEEDLNIKGDLTFRSSTIYDLPDNLRISGNLDLQGCADFKHLPKNLKVDGDLILLDCESLQSLSDNLYVGGTLDLTNCDELKFLPENLFIGKNLILDNCIGITSLPRSLIIGQNLTLTGSGVRHYTTNDIRRNIKFFGGVITY
jgi:hypothetical protein